jgi:hypothetical protein
MAAHRALPYGMRSAPRIALVAALILAPACASVAYVTQVWDADPAADVTGLSAPRPALAPVGPGRVILVTLDGARWQDVLHQGLTLSDTPAMPQLMAAARDNGVVLRATTSSALPLSLPGYQAIYAGAPTPCDSNECPRPTTATLLDDVLAQGDAAVFASWAKLPDAFRDGTAATVNAPALGPGEAPWENARLDATTIRAGVAFWRAHHPRFFHLALLDMDQLGHAGDAPGIVASLRQADDAIAALLAAVAELPPAERDATTVVVTADHGRGPGRLWRHHSRYASARNIFVVAVGARVGAGWPVATQADLRPALARLVSGR